MKVLPRLIRTRFFYFPTPTKLASYHNLPWLTRTPDYIIVGGGIAGCVTASRLHEKNTSLDILLIEAGADASEHPLVPGVMTTQQLLHSELDWDYKTVPQCHLNNRECYAAAGKALGGGSVINACMSYLACRKVSTNYLLTSLRRLDSRRGK